MLKVAGISDKDILNADGSVKVEKMTFHCVRHSYCSYLSEQGVELAMVATLAGHRDISTTRKYIHHSDDKQQELNNNLAKAMGI